jgi:hypothetical protein
VTPEAQREVDAFKARSDSRAAPGTPIKLPAPSVPPSPPTGLTPAETKIAEEYGD